MSLIGLVVFLVIVGLICWVIGQLAGAFNIPQPIVTVLYVIVVIFVVVYLLQLLGGVELPVLRIR